MPIRGASGPHAQTILASLLRVPRPPELRRERYETPDEDFLVVEWLHAPPTAPHVLVLHGLEGSSRAGYVVETIRRVAERGWGAVALNFRSCSGEPNRKLRSYNSGDITDAQFLVEKIRASGITGPLFGVGFSLGGSVLLNLMERTGEACPLDGGVAISVPFDLGACARMLDENKGLTALYRHRFLRTLKTKTLHKCQRHPGEVDPEAVRRARGIREFDDAVTAKLFGFTSADDYYAQCSTGPRLGDLRRPTLLITSEDDPMAPASALPADAEENPWVSIVRTARGGHVGFMSGTPLARTFWAEAQALRFFEQLVASR